MEIDDCMMIEDDDILFLSSGADYIMPTVIDTDGPSHENNSTHSHAMKPPPLVGSYKVGDVLGRGGFGEVRVGIHQLTSEKVALKFMKKSEIQSIGAAERTATEIQCLTALQHPNIIRLQQVYTVTTLTLLHIYLYVCNSSLLITMCIYIHYLAFIACRAAPVRRTRIRTDGGR